MTDKEVFEEVKKRVTDPYVLDLLRAGLADPKEMEDIKRAVRYGDDAMNNPKMRDSIYKTFSRLLDVVKGDSTTRQMVKQDLRKLQKGDSAMSEDLNTANVEKAIQHDCAKHVVHEEWGKGECIAGEHTLLDDGTVTHYDVMFEHGIEQNVSVADLTILVEMNHGHSRKKKSAMEEEAVTPEGGEDTSKASKKGKLEMPLEKLKAIMEKKKSEAYKAMLRSQGKMEEAAKTGSVRYSDDGDITHRVLHSSGQNHLTMTHHNEHPGNIKFHGKMDGHTIKFTANPKNKDDFDPSTKDIKTDLKQAHPSLPPEVHAKVLNHATSGLKHLALDLEEETEYVPTQRSNFVGKSHLKRDHSDELGSRYVFSTDPAKMKKSYSTEKGQKNAANRNVANLKATIKSSLGKHSKPNLPEELVGNQHRIDANKNGKIDAHDFKLLKAKKKTMKEFVEQLAESLAPTLNEEADDSPIYKKYPKSNNLHLVTHDGEQHHVIQGVPDTLDNVDRAYEHTMRAGAKHAGMKRSHYEEAFQNLETHHIGVDAAEQHSLHQHDKPTKVHKSIKAYAEHHAPGDAAYAKEYHAEVNAQS